MLPSLWDFSSLTRGQILAIALKAQSLNLWTAGNSLDIIIQTSFWGNVLNLPEKNN